MIDDGKFIPVILTIGRIQSFWYLDSSYLRMTEPLRVPKISIETPEFLLDFERDLSVFPHRVDLQSIADNTRIEEDRLKFSIGHFSNPSNIPTIKE